MRNKKFEHRIARPERTRSREDPANSLSVPDRSKPVAPAARAVLEPTFGHSFGEVRIFADDQASESARSLDASAFTVGQDVFFAQGAYDPGSPGGLHLLAHELAHTVQQRGATDPPTRSSGPRRLLPMPRWLATPCR
jgi:hypothetical protein